MSYQLEFTAKAIEDIEYFKKTGNKKLLKKIFDLLDQIAQTPFEGIGKPEPLKHQFSGFWSRRIDREHRIIYKVENEKIIIIFSTKGHYD